MVLVFVLHDSHLRPVPRLFPHLRAGDAANPGRGPLPRARDERIRAGVEPDVPERVFAQRRRGMGGATRGVGGRGGDHAGLRLVVAGAGWGVEEDCAGAQSGLIA